MRIFQRTELPRTHSFRLNSPFPSNKHNFLPLQIPPIMASETTPLLAQEQGLDSSSLRTNHVPEQEPTWPTESLLILQYSTPLIGTYLLQYLYSLTIILFVSHLGTDALAAVSLGITTMNIVGFAIFEGMATALDTLCAQAYGSGNLKLVGLHTQRMILFLLLVATPIGAIWICSPWILGAIVPQKNLAVLAGSFLRVSLIGVPGYAVFEAGKRFVQAQGNFTAALVVLVVCAPVNLFLNWLFVVVRFPFLLSRLVLSLLRHLPTFSSRLHLSSNVHSVSNSASPALP
jgi:multidrug resistance protein, MATE family